MRVNANQAKARISAVVPVFIVKALKDFQRSAGLKSMSAAAAKALGDWAEDAQRDERVKKAVAKYGAIFGKEADFGEAQAKKLAPLYKAVRPNF